MKHKKSFGYFSRSALLALVALHSGCATFGIVYEDVGHPPISLVPGSNGASAGWDPNLNASLGGRALVKRGVACSQDILKLVAWGDATQAAAAQRGGITEVVGLDFENTAILGFFYTKNCTVVYGTDTPQTVSAAPLSVAPAAPAAPALAEPADPDPGAPAPAHEPEDVNDSVSDAPGPTPAPPAPAN